jgi:serine/threonine protein kinase
MDIIDLEELGVPLKIDLKLPIFSNFENFIGFEDLFGNLIDKKRRKRCTIKYSSKQIMGGYGIITFAKRIVNSDTENCVVKCLLGNEELNLFKEAFLQYTSYLILKKYNLHLFIPKIYDIFYKLNTIQNKYMLHFSMEEIIGVYFHNFLNTSETPEKDFIDSFIQICIALYILQNELNLDHRDLRYANIYIVEKPVHIMLKLVDKNIDYTCNFHICILDFGFACIGHKPTILNAAEGFMQKEERCFKPGRDLFQLLISIWSKRSIRSRMNETFIENINSILCYGEYDYSKITDTSEDSKWPYSLTMDDNFSFVPLLPKNLLIKLIELKNEYNI